MDKFVNLTPHAITIRNGDLMITVEPEATPARVSTEEEVLGEIQGVPLVRRKFGVPEGIPEPQEGVTFIVSSIVAAATTRADVVAPDTGPTAIRNEKGQILAVTRLIAAG